MSDKKYTYTTTAPDVVYWNGPVYREYQIRIKAMWAWCDENLEDWGYSGKPKGCHEFWFVSEEDLTLFILRWSGS